MVPVLLAVQHDIWLNAEMNEQLWAIIDRVVPDFHYEVPVMVPVCVVLIGAWLRWERRKG